MDTFHHVMLNSDSNCKEIVLEWTESNQSQILISTKAFMQNLSDHTIIFLCHEHVFKHNRYSSCHLHSFKFAPISKKILDKR